MNLENLKSIFTKNGCTKIFVKRLSANDNSKNQVYLGGSFEILNILPIDKIINDPAGDWNKERFKATINFGWITDDGNIHPAPQSQLILYPKYPEVRFSGFLNRCDNPPSDLMTIRLPNRLLFLSVTTDRKILGYVVGPDSTLATEFYSLNLTNEQGVFSVIELKSEQNSKEQLLTQLKRIHDLGWINSKRLDKFSNILPCDSSNCGGYTLEAELGITPNGNSEPDYLGWEIKQFGVKNLSKINSAVITLMTPEPTHGYYVTDGVEQFVRRFGYADKNGVEDRLNFGGVHKFGIKHNLTHLKLDLIGFDTSSGKIRNADGRIALLDKNDNEAASWSFSSLLLHWNRKHNNACYVPSLSDKSTVRKYQYGDKIILGSITDFSFFLNQMAQGKIYYDPGIKMENASSKPTIKRRSQFRIKSTNLSNLYKHNEVVLLS